MTSPQGQPSTRADAIAEILAKPSFDLLIVGGGIVGAGVARDAAMRGLRTLLVDRHDFAFGTSSRSSRLLHGGLRYLAQGRIGLVREASREKLVLRRIAPHLTQPLAFTFPTYKRSGWPRWKLRIGVKLYDWLCGDGNLGRSGGMSRAEVANHIAGLRTDGLTGGVRYFDGFTNDARLVLDTLRSAAASGATVVNYLQLASAGRRDRGWECRLTDIESPARTIAVHARTVVNAAGAWATELPESRVKLRLTKGVHVVIRRERLSVPDAVVMTDGPRILFAIPWGERTILGTTDTDYAGDIDSPDCTDADVDYILKVVNRSFPSAAISPADVISAWSGLRPLIADRHGRPSDVSRAHEIIAGEPGWFDIAGGKLTTYRLMAEQMVDRVVQHLGVDAAPCRTADTPILPNDTDFKSEISDLKFSGVTPPAIDEEVVAHACRREWAMHLDDVMIRRTGWLYYELDHLAIAGKVADWMAGALDWSPERTAAELERYRRMTAPRAATWSPPPMS